MPNNLRDELVQETVRDVKALLLSKKPTTLEAEEILWRNLLLVLFEVHAGNGRAVANDIANTVEDMIDGLMSGQITTNERRLLH